MNNSTIHACVTCNRAVPAENNAMYFEIFRTGDLMMALCVEPHHLLPFLDCPGKPDVVQYLQIGHPVLKNYDPAEAPFVQLTYNRMQLAIPGIRSGGLDMWNPRTLMLV